MLVNAQTDGSLVSGYSVTSNWHGNSVPLGSEVVVTAKTADAFVGRVLFVWKNPACHVIWTDIVHIHRDGYFQEKPVYIAQSTHTPEDMGDLGVQAIFLNLFGRCRWYCHRIIAARGGTSFNVVSEVPIVGTAGASIVMLLGVTYKLKRKPKK